MNAAAQREGKLRAPPEEGPTRVLPGEAMGGPAEGGQAELGAPGEPETAPRQGSPAEMVRINTKNSQKFPVDFEDKEVSTFV